MTILRAALYTWPVTSYADNPRQFLIRLVGAWLVLTVLFAVLAPASSFPLNLQSRLLFWALHIGIGLILTSAAVRLLLGFTDIPRDWRLILSSAALGIVAFAPIALFLESLFPSLSDTELDSALDIWRTTGLGPAIVVEAIALAPPFTVAWCLINLESLQHKRRPAAPVDTPTIAQSAPPAPMPLPFRLPKAIGEDIVAISTDLHYLHVSTVAGQAMVLGALADAEQALGPLGLRVHRAHWIATGHVRQLIRHGNQWLVEMDNDQRIPVSRRKRALVREQLGTDFKLIAGTG